MIATLEEPATLTRIEQCAECKTQFNYAPVMLSIQTQSSSSVADGSPYPGATVTYALYRDGVQMPLSNVTVSGFAVNVNSGFYVPNSSRAYLWNGSPACNPGFAPTIQNNNLIIIDGEVVSGSHTYDLYAVSTDITHDSGYPYYTPLNGTATINSVYTVMNVTFPVR